MLELKIEPLQYLKSDRLHLRRVVNDDVKQVLALRGNKDLLQYVPLPIIENEEGAYKYIKAVNDKIISNEAAQWGITLNGNSTLIGTIGLYRIKPEHYRAEIGYILLPAFHKKGIATEAIHLVLEYAFNQLNLHSVEAIIDPNNIASEKPLIKNNFIKEAHFKENEFYDGKFIDSVYYSLLKRNFKTQKM